MPAAPVLDSPPGSRPSASDEPVQVRLLFDAASERIIDVAGAVRTLLQYDAEQLRGQSLSTLIEPLPGQRTLPWSAAQPGDSADESIVTVLTRHGLRHLVSAQATAFRRADGGVMGLLLLSDWVRHESGAHAPAPAPADTGLRAHGGRVARARTGGQRTS